MHSAKLAIAVLVLGPWAFGCGGDDDSSGGNGGATGGSSGGGGTAGQSGSGGATGGTGGTGGATGGTGGATGGSGGSTQTFDPPTFTEQQVTDTAGENGRWAIMTDTTDGYAIAYAHGVDSSPGSYDLVVLELDDSGQQLWSTSIPDLLYGRCSIATKDASVGVVCSDDSGMGMVVIDTDGTASPAVAISAQSPAGDLNVSDSSLVWTGTEWGLAWSAQDTSGLVDSNGTSIFFARYDEAGALKGSPIAIETESDTGYSPSLVWTGTEYAVAYVGTSNFHIKFARIDATGQLVGSLVNVNTEGWAGQPKLVWNGTNFGIAWGDDRDNDVGDDDVYFRLLDASGVGVGSLVKVTNSGNCYDRSLVWTGDAFGLAWSWFDNESTVQPHIDFASFDPQGVMLGTTTLANTWNSAPMPELVYAHDTYAMAWHQIPDPFGGDTEPQVFFAVSP